MSVERPWHAEALRMKAEGLSGHEISKRLGLASAVIYRFLNPEYARKHRAFVAERTAERKAADPAFREHRRVLGRQAEKRYRIRRAAREEAAETGVPVEQIYEKWGVPL